MIKLTSFQSAGVSIVPRSAGDECSLTSRTVRRRRWRPIAVGVAGTVVTLASGGCGAVGSSSSASGSYWLIKASGSYGTIYGYPSGDRAAPSAHAQYLGPTAADAHANAPAAAKRLGVTHLDPGIY